MSNRSESSKNSSSSDKGSEAFAVGALLCMALIAIAKYFPPIALGALIGALLYWSRYGKGVLLRIKTYVLSLSFFTFLCYALITFPDRDKKTDFIGLLWWIPGFWDWCWSWTTFWNENAPGLSFLKGLRVKSLSPLDVQHYVWISIFSAVVFSGIYFGLSLFKAQKRKKARLDWHEDSEGAGLFAVASVPAHLFELLISSPLSIAWLRLGIRTACQGKSLEIFSFTMALLGVGFVAGHYLTPMIPFTNLREPAYFLGYLPAISALTGMFLGQILPESTLLSLGYSVSSGSSKEATSQRLVRGDFVLGKSLLHGKEFRLTERNLGYHVDMIAPSGAGKTTTLKSLIADRIGRGHGVIFLDLKGEFDVVSWIYRAAKHFGREEEIRLLSLTNRELSVPYNPIKHGSAHELHSQLMNAMPWSEEYYRKIASVALMTVLRGLCEYRDKTGERFTLLHLYSLLERPGLLRAFNEKLARLGCPSSQDIARLAEQLDRPSEKDKLSGLVANLNLLIFSAAGPLLTEDAARGSFDFKEAVDEGRISYFLMNSLKLKESASVLGKMILQDLMSFVGERYAQIDRGTPHRPITLIIDEFASFAIPEFIEFMDRARGAGIGIVIAHQSRADLRAISPEFQERIEANSNTTIVSGIKSSQDAEHYAGMIGTRTVEKETRQVEDGLFWDNHTGMKSIREVEEYVVHPNQLKELKQGQVFAVSRTIDPRWGLVQIPPAPEFQEQAISSQELSRELSAIRSGYLNSGREKSLDLERLAANYSAGLKRGQGTSGEAPRSESGEKKDLWR